MRSRHRARRGRRRAALPSRGDGIHPARDAGRGDGAGGEGPPPRPPGGAGDVLPLRLERRPAHPVPQRPVPLHRAIHAGAQALHGRGRPRPRGRGRLVRGGTFIDPFAAQDAAMMTGFTTFALYFVALFHSWRVERRDVKARRHPRVEPERGALGAPRALRGLLDGVPGRRGRAPAPMDRAPELTGTAEWDGRSSARTPIWLWALLAAIAVGGGRTALSWAREANTEPEPLAPASPGMWEDIEADPVHLDTAGAGDSTGLDEPLLRPEGTAPDTTGT
ncbi:MAG: hypothetical protein MZV63_06490 [Marinilabiliales bacterium]|nr:hypothetical protein [Marinilabiliales bacterium]